MKNIFHASRATSSTPFTPAWYTLLIAFASFSLRTRTFALSAAVGGDGGGEEGGGGGDGGDGGGDGGDGGDGDGGGDGNHPSP